MARPSTYRSEYAAQATKLCRLGATDKDLADFFSVSEATINNWKLRFPEFVESLKVGKDAADLRVERSLFERATGYSHPAIKQFCYEGVVTEAPYTEHYAPDTTACIFWLKNRKPEEWRDRQEHTGPNGGPIQVQASEWRFGDRLIAFGNRKTPEKASNS